MAELVDATDLKSVDLLIVRVRFPLSVFAKCERVTAFFGCVGAVGIEGVAWIAASKSIYRGASSVSSRHLCRKGATILSRYQCV